jgi:hypothetical protein
MGERMSNSKDIADLGDQEIEIERYADVLAHTIHFRTAPTSEVLARLNVPAKRWNEAHAKWTRILVEEATEDDAPLARQFGTAFAVARTRLRNECPALESLGPLPVEEAPHELAPAPIAAMLAPIATPPPARVLEVEAPAPIVFSSDDASPWRVPGMPATAPGVSRFLAPAPLVQAPVIEPEISWVPAGMRAFTSIDGTHVGAAAPTGLALPFDGSARARAAGLENALAQATRNEGPAPDAAIGEAPGATMELSGLRALVQSAALPFQSGTGAPSIPRPSSDPAEALAATMSLSGLRAIVGAAPLPFPSAAGPAPMAQVMFPIERYASLCVELSVAPAQRAATLLRYQLTEVQWRALEADWQARFAREPAARPAWEKACAAYKAWLFNPRQ